MSNNTAVEDRTAPGSALQSQTPAACLCGALLVFIAIVQLAFSDYLKEVFAAQTGTVVIIIWALCAAGLAAIASWASREKNRANASLADLMPQRLIGGTLFCIALTSSLILGM